MEVSEAKRLRELETENAQLKKLLAKSALDNAALKEIASGNDDARSEAACSEAPSDRRLVRLSTPMPLLDRPNQRWLLMDFVSGQLASERRLRVLNIVADFSRECVGQLVNTSISGNRLARFLDGIVQQRSLPASIVCDNGPELCQTAQLTGLFATLGACPAICVKERFLTLLQDLN